LFTRKQKKKKMKQAYKVKECRLVVVVRSLRRKECGEAQEPRKSCSSRSKLGRRSSKKREERVASLCALAGNRAANKQDGRPDGVQPSIYALVSAPKKREATA
jgi:hypothetical protein